MDQKKHNSIVIRNFKHVRSSGYKQREIIEIQKKYMRFVESGVIKRFVPTRATIYKLSDKKLIPMNGEK